MTEAVKADPGAEAAVLGAILMAPSAMRRLVAVGLRPDHFWKDRHRAVFEAMMALEARGDGIDPQTVRSELERTGLTDRPPWEAVEDLIGVVPAAGNVRLYAERVIELAEWRNREMAALRLRDAAANQDQHAWIEAQVFAQDVLRQRRTQTYSPEQWADELYEYFVREAPPQAIPLPIPRLTELAEGGMRPGETMLLAGYTNHGKSVFADQILDHAADRGFRCHAYLTEMSAIGRGLRLLSRRTGIKHRKLRERKLDDHQTKQILNELALLNYGITIATDWSIDEVVADALYARWDLVVIDLIHGFHYEDERALDRLSKAVQRLAVTSTTIEGFEGTAVVGVAHLNESQMSGASPKRPRPGMQSIKGGSSLKQDADFVTFVWQEDDDDGTPTGQGRIWFTKARNADLGGVDVVLNPKRFRFEIPAQEELS